jgi:hypothetical protein
MQRAAARWPHLASRIEKAQQSLLDGNVDAIDYRWRVWSQNNNGKSYAVSTIDERACACPDFQQGSAPRAEGRIFCKHLIALAAYVEILKSHLAIRHAGRSQDRQTRELLRLYPNTYLMRIEATATLTNLEQPAIHFQTCWSSRGTSFASDADAIIFANWLANARPIPKLEPDHYQVAPAPTGNQSNWTRQQWQHWYATGETPALAATT